MKQDPEPERRVSSLVLRWLPWVVTGLVGLTALAMLVPALLVRVGLRAERTAVYRPDDVIDVDRRVYEGSAYTLVVFARSSCSGCQKVRPLLRELIAAARTSARVQPRMIGVAGAGPDELAFGSLLGLTADEIVDGEGLELRARTVPTVVLVSQQGRVVFSIEGARGPEAYQAGAASIRQLAGGSAR